MVVLADGRRLRTPVRRVQNFRHMSTINDGGTWLRPQPYERLLAELNEATYSPDHPTVGARLSNLALVRQDLGQAAAARPLLERALHIAETTYGPDHPRTRLLQSNLTNLNPPGEPGVPAPRGFTLKRIRKRLTGSR
jgi:hypothetical protein